MIFEVFKNSFETYAVVFFVCFCFLRKIGTSNRRNVASNSRPTAPPSDHSLDRHEQRGLESKTTSLLRSGALSDIIGAPALL